MSEKETEYFGVLAEFETPAEIYHACEQVRDAGYTKWDAYTPFPVHGLDHAMGLKDSRLAWVVLVMALSGTSIAMLMQWWMNAVDYKYIISGKPFFSWPAFIPVTFELTILLGALGAVFGMLGFNRLPQYYHSLFRSERFKEVTNNRFFIAIEVKDPAFDPIDTTQLLKDCGACHTEMVEL